jgi:hypothetical protein
MILSYLAVAFGEDDIEYPRSPHAVRKSTYGVVDPLTGRSQFLPRMAKDPKGYSIDKAQENIEFLVSVGNSEL